MKNFFAAASLLIALTATSLVAQTTQTMTAPVAGATHIGTFSMDLAIMSAPQPDLTYATDNDRTAVDVGVFLVSGTNGNPDQVLVTTDDGNTIAEWAQNDAMYRTATKQYLFEKAGAYMVWMAHELGYDVNLDAQKTFIDEVNPDGSILARTKLAYDIVYNGGNTEVYLITATKN